MTGSNQGVILEIRRERAIELTQEGFRFDDLVRWKAGACINQSIMGMYFPGAGEYDLSGDGQIDVVLYDEGDTEPRDYLYPIPINERSLNPNLTQNPGWNDGLSF